jgi:hypothetical protein
VPLAHCWKDEVVTQFHSPSVVHAEPAGYPPELEEVPVLAGGEGAAEVAAGATGLAEEAAVGITATVETVTAGADVATAEADGTTGAAEVVGTGLTEGSPVWAKTPPAAVVELAATTGVLLTTGAEATTLAAEFPPGMGWLPVRVSIVLALQLLGPVAQPRRRFATSEA